MTEIKNRYSDTGRMIKNAAWWYAAENGTNRRDGLFFAAMFLYYFTYCNQHGIFVLTEWQYRIFSLVTKYQKTQSVQKK
ncbi:TPA: hypothetical protein J1Z64_004524 [Escherichia coli]|nr:hypothetical protein [Escherichia coli]